MNKRTYGLRYATVVMLLAVLIPSLSLAQRANAKLAQTGMKFLNVSAHARQAALGEAFTAADGYSASMFYNPAGMARLGMFAEASLGRVNWIADIEHTFASVAFAPWDGDYGVFGFTFQYVNYGEIQSTILANNANGYLDVGTIKPNATMFGLGYARSLTDKFSIGANVKVVTQDLGTGITKTSYVTGTDGLATGIKDPEQQQFKLKNVVAFDFGVMYRTGFESLTLGMTVRNFAREVTYQKEGFQLPLTFKLGMAMNVMDLFAINRETQSLLLSVDAEHPRDFPEQIRVGAEYLFLNSFAFRIGYVTPADEYSLSYGLGFQHSLAGTKFALDYSYTPFGVFNNVQRFSLRFGF
ncbi:MAG: PorV/PorQ family protein [Ignavibacteria bacterium]|nr:PorV/PorQ family protein [Ignavibacteria bacterium]